MIAHWTKRLQIKRNLMHRFFPFFFPTYLILIIFVLICLLEKFLHSFYKDLKKCNKLILYFAMFLPRSVFRKIIYQLFF